MSARKPSKAADRAKVLSLEFSDHERLPLLFGEHDQNLLRVERQLDVHLASRGNYLQVTGAPDAVAAAGAALRALYDRLGKGMEVGDGEVDAAIRLAKSDSPDAAGSIHADELAVVTRRGAISPRSAGQARYLEALNKHELVFGVGPAGTGKTYLAVAKAVSLLLSGEVERIILSRPAVEAGERLGFLPGDMLEKVDPYLRPLYDALHDMLPPDQVASRLSNGEIEVAPLAFMRGRTLSHAFIILDEAQNTTPVQMKMFLTRMGEKSRMVVTGDLTQIDLPRGQPSGLRQVIEVLQGLTEVSLVNFDERDVVRHSLVTRIVRAYSDYEAAAKAGRETDDASGNS